jgi:hypothetical protein
LCKFFHLSILAFFTVKATHAPNALLTLALHLKEFRSPFGPARASTHHLQFLVSAPCAHTPLPVSFLAFFEADSKNLKTESSLQGTNLLICGILHTNVCRTRCHAPSRVTTSSSMRCPTNMSVLSRVTRRNSLLHITSCASRTTQMFIRLGLPNLTL